MLRVRVRRAASLSLPEEPDSELLAYLRQEEATRALLMARARGADAETLMRLRETERAAYLSCQSWTLGDM